VNVKEKEREREKVKIFGEFFFCCSSVRRSRRNQCSL